MLQLTRSISSQFSQTVLSRSFNVNRALSSTTFVFHPSTERRKETNISLLFTIPQTSHKSLEGGACLMIDPYQQLIHHVADYPDYLPQVTYSTNFDRNREFRKLTSCIRPFLLQSLNFKFSFDG